MAKKIENKAVETKAVEEKKVVKTNYKELAESIEAAFKTNKAVDVVADTKLQDPKALSEDDFRYIHFYKAGTTKNMFGCYLIGKGKVRYALSLSVAEFLDKGLTVKPVERKKGEEKRLVAIDVICEMQDAVSVAEKIIAAYQSIPAKVKPEKKETKKAEEKKEVKKTTAKRTATKKAVNK